MSEKSDDYFLCVPWRSILMVNVHPCNRFLHLQVEAACPLEPEEVEELRCVNDYPPPTFRKVLDSVKKAFPTGR